MLDELVTKMSAQQERTEDRVLQLERDVRKLSQTLERVIGQLQTFAEDVKRKIDALASLAPAPNSGGFVPPQKPAALRETLDSDWSQSGPLNPQ